MPGDYTRCPFSYALFLGTTVLLTHLYRSKKNKKTDKKIAVSSTPALPVCDVVFVLGGPGAGKGTQCQLLQERLEDGIAWQHLSAGDLLRAERKTGGELGNLINAKIASGALVPSEITCKLLENAMIQKNSEEKATTKFLIDGFPRSYENMKAWEDTMARHNIKFVLNFECPEEVLVGRLLERGQNSGRNDDKIDVIRKRFKTYQDESIPIIKYIKNDLKITVHKIASDQSIEQVYSKVVALFL